MRFRPSPAAVGKIRHRSAAHPSLTGAVVSLDARVPVRILGIRRRAARQPVRAGGADAQLAVARRDRRDRAGSGNYAACGGGEAGPLPPAGGVLSDRADRRFLCPGHGGTRVAPEAAHPGRLGLSIAVALVAAVLDYYSRKRGLGNGDLSRRAAHEADFNSLVFRFPQSGSPVLSLLPNAFLPAANSPSKREDGLFARLYIACLGADDGRFGKPRVLRLAPGNVQPAGTDYEGSRGDRPTRDASSRSGARPGRLRSSRRRPSGSPA